VIVGFTPGAAADITAPVLGEGNDLWTLADITQPLYLGMPPYREWRLKRRTDGKTVGLSFEGAC
jgi:hypothetical protein